VRRQRDIIYIENEVIGEVDEFELHSGTSTVYNIHDGPDTFKSTFLEKLFTK